MKKIKVDETEQEIIIRIEKEDTKTIEELKQILIKYLYNNARVGRSFNDTDVEIMKLLLNN